MRKILFPVLLSCSFLSCSSQQKRNPFAAPEVNPVFTIPEGRLAPEQLWFLSEIDRGTHNKYEYRTSSGVLFLDRALCPRKVAGSSRTVQDFPVAYGISPGRFNIDLDPLDLNVLGRPAEDTPGLPRIVRVIGTMKFDECENVPCRSEKEWKEDWKVLAVEDADPSYEHVADVTNLSTADVSAIKDFFSNYKGPRKGADGREHPQTRVTGFLGKADTLALIAKDFPLLTEEKRKEEVDDCEARYEELAEAKPEPAFNEKYLSCLQRVRNPHALPGSKSFDYFLRYNAGMRLLGLKEKDVTLENAFARMEARRGAGKTYYRFVSRDQPAPGTGVEVFEWVETKDRNKGCPENFPAQHYASRPLVDLQ